jgi:autophagy-related protein 9
MTVAAEVAGPSGPGPSERKPEMSLIDRTTPYMYDRALRQSQHAATTRRRHGGAGSGSVLASNNGRDAGSLLVPGGMMASSVYQSGVGGLAMAQTAVLGDSQGSVTLNSEGAGVAGRDEAIPDEDLAPDGGVGSALGESYVDGGKRAKTNTQQQGGDEEEDGLEDGGILGLLAQIYGGRGGLHA